MNLNEIPTPALILDKNVLMRNCSYMAERMQNHKISLRPHLKTAKSIKVAEIATRGHFGGITVSTLAEARYFVNNGVRDITYAVGITPDKLDEVHRLQSGGARINIITDNVDMVLQIENKATNLNDMFNILIEVDTGGLRGGVTPNSDDLLKLAHMITDADKLKFEGVLTHAGHSYQCRGVDQIKTVAEQERSGVVLASERIRSEGIRCRVVSAGSTPTAVFAENLEGITEMRPGAYVFFDLDQVGMGVCSLDDIAVSVLATVIGHKSESQKLLLDAGSLALSKDLSANKFIKNAGYGLVCNIENTTPIPGFYVEETYQEHGVVASSLGTLPYDSLPVGTKLRILPNHSCITSAAYSNYYVIEYGKREIEVWDRINGW